MIINRALPRHPLSERGGRRPGCVAPSNKQLPGCVAPANQCHTFSVAPSGLWMRGCDCVQGFRCAPPPPVFRRPFGALGSALIMGLLSTAATMPRRGIISITPDKRSAVWGFGSFPLRSLYNICTILVQYLYVYQLYKYCTTIVHILYNCRSVYGQSAVF